jgi:hypothetical protein
MCLCTAPSQAAHLVAYDVNSGFWGQADSYIDDADIMVPSSPVSNAGSTSCEASKTEYTAYSYADGVINVCFNLKNRFLRQLARKTNDPVIIKIH